MSLEPLVFASGPANDKGIDRAELLLKLRGVESVEVAHPTRQDWANPGGDLRQTKVASTMHSPTAHAEPHPLASRFTDRWDKCDEAFSVMVARQSWPECIAEKVERPRRVLSGPICIHAIHDLGLLRMQL
jgi:hypothetical protein